ncbi:MAG: tRNA pseudouridine(38-40) synthase TruA [Candidatus Helarchaeota archaeon]
MSNDSGVNRYALKVFYLGDRYLGFQTQRNNRTVQEFIINALRKSGYIDDEKAAKFGYSGRTDRYVHSLGQVIAFNSVNKLIIPKINSYLPEDIRFYAYARVSPDFSPRYHAIYRHYKYLTWTNDLDIKIMKKASKEFLGEHNFRLLSKRGLSNESINKNTVRKIFEIKIEQIKDGLLVIDVIGESFLYEMVRRIVGVLLAVGRGELNTHEIKNYFDLNMANKIKIRRAPIKTGGDLILFECKYDIDFKYDEYSTKRIRNYLFDLFKDHYIKSQSIKTMFKAFNQKL